MLLDTFTSSNNSIKRYFLPDRSHILVQVKIELPFCTAFVLRLAFYSGCSRGLRLLLRRRGYAGILSSRPPKTCTPCIGLIMIAAFISAFWHCFPSRLPFIRIRRRSLVASKLSTRDTLGSTSLFKMKLKVLAHLT